MRPTTATDVVIAPEIASLLLGRIVEPPLGGRLVARVAPLIRVLRLQLPPSEFPASVPLAGGWRPTAAPSLVVERTPLLAPRTRRGRLHHRGREEATTKLLLLGPETTALLLLHRPAKVHAHGLLLLL